MQRPRHTGFCLFHVALVGLATIRQRIRKYNREPPFEAEIAKYRENPDAAGEVEEEEEDQESDEDDDDVDDDSKEPSPIEAKK